MSAFETIPVLGLSAPPEARRGTAAQPAGVAPVKRSTRHATRRVLLGLWLTGVSVPLLTLLLRGCFGPSLRDASGLLSFLLILPPAGIGLLIVLAVGRTAADARALLLAALAMAAMVRLYAPADAAGIELFSAAHGDELQRIGASLGSGRLSKVDRDALLARLEALGVTWRATTSASYDFELGGGADLRYLRRDTEPIDRCAGFQVRALGGGWFVTRCPRPSGD